MSPGCNTSGFDRSSITPMSSSADIRNRMVRAMLTTISNREFEVRLNQGISLSKSIVDAETGIFWEENMVLWCMGAFPEF